VFFSNPPTLPPQANKLLIARDGIRLLTSVMNTHISNSGLQEAACDLIWSLAFNNNLVKEVIGRQGGIPVIIKGMRTHAGCADLLKSSCGALSNMCQNAHNQSLIAAHGGTACILESLRRHAGNANLLPFVFDALASLIVGNERNAREVSEQGAIELVLQAVQAHGQKGELVKSGCHALAILSDSQGQGAKIAQGEQAKHARVPASPRSLVPALSCPLPPPPPPPSPQPAAWPPCCPPCACTRTTWTCTAWRPWCCCACCRRRRWRARSRRSAACRSCSKCWARRRTRWRRWRPRATSCTR
jgi:hypothetical protein